MRIRNQHIFDWRAGKKDHIPESLHAALEEREGPAGSEKNTPKTKDAPIIKRKKDE